MPSLAVSGKSSSSETPQDKKEKNVKSADADIGKNLEFDPSMTLEKKVKKEKRSKKNKINSESDSEELRTNPNDPEEKRKGKKKRKAAEIENDCEEERSETSSELGEPMNLMKTGKKKAQLTEADDGDDNNTEEKAQNEEHPNSLSKFRISNRLREVLTERGIRYLFPIQAMTFDTILDGSDLVGRARTGQVCSLATLHCSICLCNPNVLFYKDTCMI